MRIGIYNRYWSTRGGGERYAGVIAETLASQHSVELIGSVPLQTEDLSDHLGLDLGSTRFLVWPDVPESVLSPLTANYDLFINCTYLSRLRTQAPKSVYIVLFPQRSWNPTLVRTLRRGLDLLAPPGRGPVEPLMGFYPPDPDGSRWCGARAVLGLTGDAFEGGQARVIFHPATPWPLQEALLAIECPGLNGIVESDAIVFRPSHKGEPRDFYQVELTCKTFLPRNQGQSRDTRELGLYMTPRSSRIRASYRSFLDRVRSYLDAFDPSVPRGYDLLVSISEFTRTWVEKRWNQSSTVLPPPIDVDTFQPPDLVDKKRRILSVGRFFQGSHNKKHRQMVEVFRGMWDRGEIPRGWEYHLVGNLHHRQVDADYFAELERLAEGYPIRLMVDLPLDRLIEEYRAASIFWHAAGWGEKETRDPEKLEHFGITTCEAMSAGCVPVVIAKAGQVEIVQHGDNGFLFHDGEELAELTRRLIEGYGEPWTHDLMRRASISVQRFGRDAFEEKLLDLLGRHGLLT